MKTVKELKIEELTIKQKLGMLDAAIIASHYPEETLNYVFDLIRNHSLGAVWIQVTGENPEKLTKMVREIADYPILIITDAESGIGEYKIGRHNAIGCTGSEKHAYAFGKATAVTARKMGYSIVCNPVVDVNTRGSARALGSNKYEVARLAAAVARGMHDAGILTVAKHYPSGTTPRYIDSHMEEGYSEQTREELLDYSLYAYKQLMKEGLIDGIMVGHHRFPKIDDKYPASLSKKVIDIIKDEGFEGFFITDALSMMGIIGKFGKTESKGMAIAAGNDLALSFTRETQVNHEAIISGFENGIFDEERLNDAVRHVLEAQRKSMAEPKYTELTDEEIALCKSINGDAVYERSDEGISPSISKDGRHLFAVMVRNQQDITADGGVEVDTFSSPWLSPSAVINKLQKTFPNSKVLAYHQFPHSNQNQRILTDSVDYDDLIFLTFSENLAYSGGDHLTRRVEALINAAQSTGRVSALLHFGNPCILNNLVHIPRHILGGLSAESIDAAIDILAGDREAKGVLTYDVTLN